MTESIQPARPADTSSGRAQSGAASKLSSKSQPNQEDWRAAAHAAGAPEAAFDPDSGTAEEREEARSVTNDPEAQAQKAEEDLIYLKSGLEGDLTALYEKHPDHPNGEVFVGPDMVAGAAKTPMVMDKLNSGDVVEVDKGDFDEYVAYQKEERKLALEERDLPETDRVAAKEERAVARREKLAEASKK